MSDSSLTLPDLVVLGVLTERPLHGYELNRELERREVADWAAISRPQVYYSLRKLAAGGYLARTASAGLGPGPERQVYRVTAAGRRALTAALDRDEWATQRPPPPFLTWMALSPYAGPEVRRRMIRRRRVYLEEELARERATQDAIAADTGPMVPVARQMVRLVIRQWEVELAWLAEVERELSEHGGGLARPTPPV